MAIILEPVIALAAWTLIMCLWMYATRLPGMMKANVDPDSLARDPEASLDKLLPPQTQWKAHNFNHLHEAPTVFYAVMLSMALLATQASFSLSGEQLIAFVGWIYVALRIAHSIVQATWNKVVVRFALFSLSQIALVVLVGLAIYRVATF